MSHSEIRLAEIPIPKICYVAEWHILIATVHKRFARGIKFNSTDLHVVLCAM